MEKELPPLKKMDYYVTLDGGNCSIVKSSSKHLAECFAIRLFGSMMTPEILEATPDQVSWVKAMGGRVHEIE